MIRAVSTTMSYSPLSIIRNDDGVLGCATYSATRKKAYSDLYLIWNMTSPLCYRECMIKMRVPKIIITDMADSARGTSFAPCCSNTQTRSNELSDCAAWRSSRSLRLKFVHCKMQNYNFRFTIFNK